MSDLESGAAEALLGALARGDVARTAARICAESVGSPYAKLYVVTDGIPRSVATHPDGASAADPGDRLAASIAQAAGADAAVTNAETGEAVVPVRSERRDIGAVVVQPPSGRAFAPDQLQSLSRTGRLAGVALELDRALNEAHLAAERLTELDRTKTEFLNIASHELRGPLTVVMGYMSLLEDGAFGELPSDFARELPAINARITEMESLINAMLETSRLDDDRMLLDLATPDLREIVAEAAHRVEVFVQPGQHVTISQPERPVIVKVDRTRIIEALVNLLSNALKFSPDHTDVSCELQAGEITASIAVVDRGIGVAESDKPILFTRFGRVRSDPVVRSVPGTGLGLHLARELARAHGGDITVVSAPGAGSTFTLSLPLAR